MEYKSIGGIGNVDRDAKSFLINNDKMGFINVISLHFCCQIGSYLPNLGIFILEIYLHYLVGCSCK